MESIKYPYSKSQIWYLIILFLALMAFLFFMIATHTTDRDAWPIFGFSFPALCGMLAYLMRKYYLPMRRGDIALELEEEKLQHFISNKTVYWKDVQYIDGLPGKDSMGVRFAIKESSENVTISLRFVAGDDNAIYKTITGYFEKYG